MSSPANASGGSVGSAGSDGVNVPLDIAKKEIYSYEAPWTIYAMDFSCRRDHPFRVALGSFVEEYCNKIRVIELNEESEELEQMFETDHPYPATKLMWLPNKSTKHLDLMGTSGDYMRIWQVKDGSITLLHTLTNNKRTDYCAPLTSFDWNEEDPRILGTSSIDTTCTIWDIETQQSVTQLIAHDKEVYDIAFAQGTNVFASVGADGSVRMFDRRSLEHSTIIYESPNSQPLLRLAWNKQDPNYCATVSLDESSVTVLDIRVPSLPAAELSGHKDAVNSLAWAPHSACHLCTAADDSQALIWDLSPMPAKIEDPILAYNAGGEINQLVWSMLQPDWVCITYGKECQILRV